jgi:hypothetical protein
MFLFLLAPPGNCICVSGCCPVNCVPGAWSAWSACSEPCGGGSRSRSRSVTTPTCGGSPCVPTEVEACNTHGCPTNCQASTWSGWTCSASCGPAPRRDHATSLCPRPTVALVPRPAAVRVAWRATPAAARSQLQRWRLVHWGRLLGGVRRRLAVALALHHASVVRRLVLRVETSQSQYCNTGCCPSTA